MWILLRKIVVSILVIGQVEDRDENDKPIMKDKYIESHFDFKLNGNINGEEQVQVGRFWLCLF
jgi:hypothetical protein